MIGTGEKHNKVMLLFYQCSHHDVLEVLGLLRSSEENEKRYVKWN